MPDNSAVWIAPALPVTLLQLARRAAPRECCGVLLGHVAGPATPAQIVWARETANVEVQAATERFRIDPRDVLRAARAARERDLDLLGFFHSHPHGPPRPSHADIAEASAWPGTLHIIVSPADDELRIYETAPHTWYERHRSQARL